MKDIDEVINDVEDNIEKEIRENRDLLQYALENLSLSSLYTLRKENHGYVTVTMDFDISDELLDDIIEGEIYRLEKKGLVA